MRSGRWHYTKIVLSPLDTACPSIEIKVAAEDEFRVIAKFVEVFRGS
jgi:hypothetical protein